MHIDKTAVAGTLESSDVLVTVEPGSSGSVDIELEGATVARFGKQIRAVVSETLGHFGVTACRVRLQDKGALDCTIRARLSAALLRASDKPADIEWETLV